jgi:hypothetical protein
MHDVVANCTTYQRPVCSLGGHMEQSCISISGEGPWYKHYNILQMHGDACVRTEQRYDV